MTIYLKYVMLILGLIGGIMALSNGNIGAGITAASAFIAFVVIEVQDVKITNKEEE